jgi:thiamine kinase-like enzyme
LADSCSPGLVAEPGLDRAVQPLLDRVPGWRGRARAVGLLEGGITNRNVLVELAGERFVLRLSGADTGLLAIRRPDELEAARRAHAAGIGPEVVAFLEPEQYLVTRFLDASPVAAADLTTPDLLPQVATMLRRVHAGPPLAGAFDAFRIPGLHLAAAKARGVDEPAEYAEAARLAARIEAVFAGRPDTPVPCHNDLLTANFLVGGGRLWLIDWEYAGNNNRWFDLGNLAVNNSLDPAAEERLVAAYAGRVTAGALARLRLMKVMSDFREAMWGVVQQAISQLDVDYRAYATSHFERLLANGSAADFGPLLREAAGP